MNQIKDSTVINLMRTPRSADIAITNNCNLRCAYCSHFTSASDVSCDLPQEEWLKFFEELNHYAVLSVCLQGGEPFLRQDIIQIINGIVANRMRFLVLSNGTLITEEISAFLFSTRRCDGVQVSIDGSVETTHDALRGKGSFHKAIAGIKNLQKYNVPVTVRVTIHKNNLNDIEKIASFLLDEVGLCGFSTNSASYMGLCRQNSALVQLTVEERITAMEKLLILNSKYPNRISALAGPLAEAKGWLLMEEARCKKMERFPGRGYLTGCGGPMNKIAIRADGVMVPCLLLSHIELGSINKNNLEKVWQGHPALVSLRQRRFISLSEFAFCKDCSYVDYCTGSCPGLSYAIMENINHPSPDSCLRKFIKDGGRLPS